MDRYRLTRWIVSMVFGFTCFSIVGVNYKSVILAALFLLYGVVVQISGYNDKEK